MTYVEAKVKQKMAYLQRLLKLRVSLMRFATDVDVSLNDGMIAVRWNMTKPGEETLPDVITHETIEFPVAHLGRRIEHYKRKFRTEYLNRHKQ
jgi:hypothetical protein